MSLIYDWAEGGAFERRVFLLFLSGPCCCNVLPLTSPFLCCVSVPTTLARMPTSTDSMICWGPWSVCGPNDEATTHIYNTPLALLYLPCISRSCGTYHPHKKRNSVNRPPILPLRIFFGGLVTVYTPPALWLRDTFHTE